MQGRVVGRGLYPEFFVRHVLNRIGAGFLWAQVVHERCLILVEGDFVVHVKEGRVNAGLELLIVCCEEVVTLLRVIKKIEYNSYAVLSSNLFVFAVGVEDEIFGHCPSGFKVGTAHS